MLVVITTDYPLARARPRRSCGPPSRGASTGSRSTATARRTTRSILLANGASGADRDDDAFAAALDEVCGDLARQVVADGEGATVVLEIGVNGAASTAEAEAIARRIATSPLVKTAAFGHDPNWGRVLMAAGSAPLRRRVRAARHRAADGRLRRRRRLRRRLADRLRAGARRARSAGSTSSSASATARPGTSPPTSRTTTSGSTRSTRREPHRDQARRARRRRRGGRGARAARAGARRRRRPRRRAADHGRDGAPRDRPDLRRRAAGDDRRGAGRRPRARSPRSTATSAPRSGRSRVSLFGDEIGLQATQVDALGLVGDPTPSAPAAIEEALAAGRIPVVAPLRPARARSERSTSTPTRPRPRSRSGSVPSGSCSSATFPAC